MNNHQITRFLSLFIVTFLVTTFVFTPKVKADVAGAYNQGFEVCSAVVEDPNPNMANNGCSKFVNTLVIANTIFYGPEAVNPTSSMVRDLPDAYKKAALVPSTYQGIGYAFYNGPSVNIPGHYASMLLPKEFRGNLESTTYAQSGPTTQNAQQYLDYLGINKMWQVTFSLAMFGFVVIILIAGFMIIFRQRIGGQTVVTVSMALQNLVLGVIFALASYALGGFFLNLSKFLILILDGLMQAAIGSGYRGTFLMGPFSLLTGSTTLEDMFRDIQPDTCYITDLGACISGALNFVVGLIPLAIVALILLIAGFRIFMTIFTTYARMIVDIILSPLYFMISSLPGRQGGYMNWLKKMLKNSLVLPGMFFIVNFGLLIISGKIVATGQNAITSLTAGAATGDATTDLLFSIVEPHIVVGVVFLLMAPSVPSILDEMLAVQNSKAVGGGVDAAKKTAAGLPIVGSFFK